MSVPAELGGGGADHAEAREDRGELREDRRETREEVGIDLADVEPLGVLPTIQAGARRCPRRGTIRRTSRLSSRISAAASGAQGASGAIGPNL